MSVTRVASRAFRLVLALALVLPGCGSAARERRAMRGSVPDDQPGVRPGLVIGEFELAPNGVVDGDTIKVVGLEKSIRLLNIDTEETFKNATDRALFAAGWESYLRAKRGNSPHPVKMATPLGEEAKEFAKQFFGKNARVRLERDHPRGLRDRYDRYLGYVFAWKDGRWVNYNVEAVRAGMSPYFTKYGYSKRFHDEFVAAQEEARQARRGIWDPSKLHYPDYADRLLWWNARADFIREWETSGGDREDWIDLSHWDAMRLLRKNLGRQVHVLGIVQDVEGYRDPPILVHLARRRGSDLPLVFNDERVFVASGVARFKGEYVSVVGRVNEYRVEGRKYPELRVVVERPDDVKGPEKALRWSGAGLVPEDDVGLEPDEGK